jgi:hypothetical protein
LPSNWKPCDGSNGTPDLRNKFIRGTTTQSSIGNTGGSDNAIVVSHSHTASTASAGSHGHSASTNSAGSHRHYIEGHYDYGGNGNNVANSIYNPSSQNDPDTNYAGSHSHTVYVSSAGAHSHTVTVNSQGSSGTNANMPAYYTLAFIMRTS